MRLRCWHDGAHASAGDSWILSLPLVATSVLLGHSLAYALTGTAPGTMHAYLEHAPQVLLVACLLALICWGLEGRSRRPVRAPLAGFGMAVFVMQEHAERFADHGHLPFLLTDGSFLVGLVLQIPVGIACVLVARWLAVTLDAQLPRRPRPVPAVVVSLVELPAVRQASTASRRLAARGRGPPLAIRP